MREASSEVLSLDSWHWRARSTQPSRAFCRASARQRETDADVFDAVEKALS
ncbi:hypothetical protein [Streptomyces sp. bgisy029]|uniref:hypothetical protein n=1 Tax=Streptomyces sp. bgisy029 TaxID=3413771 RepID=UPI003D712A8A